MKHLKWILPGLLSLACSSFASAQAGKPDKRVLEGQTAVAMPQPHAGDVAGILSAPRERIALLILLKSLEMHVVSVADAMPADKYGFVPTDGEFKGVRTFGQQVKHLAATNRILAAAALGEDPPADAGDEVGPETVRTKAEILDYLNDSFARLRKAVDAIGDTSVPVKSSPISPLSATSVTRLALTVEALVHDFDHYGQMVEYLRMNGVVLPASRP
jgi:uncharacterized damage-inducible protein DinB